MTRSRFQPLRAPEGGSSQPDQLRRVLDQMATGQPAVDETEYLLPVGRYWDAEMHQAEMDILFGRHAQALCRASELAKPGSCLVHDLTGTPVLLVRDKEGSLRAFLNVCRHRGMRLVDEEGVCRKSTLVCPYHNWMYGLDGKLIDVPKRELGFPNIKIDEIELAELPCREAHGFAWVLLDRHGDLDLGNYLGELDADLDWFDLKGHIQFAQATSEVPANWKMILDGFFEGYHVQRLHKATLAPFFTDDDVIFDQLGLNIRTAVARQRLADEGEAADVPEDVRERLTFTYWLFPGTMLVVSPDYVNVFTFHPQGPDHTTVIDTMIVAHEPRDDAERKRWQRSFDLIHYDVFEKEDFGAAEKEQMGLRSGANEHLIAGRFERGLRMTHSQIDDVLRAGGFEPGDLAGRPLVPGQ